MNTPPNQSGFATPLVVCISCTNIKQKFLPNSIYSYFLPALSPYPLDCSVHVCHGKWRILAARISASFDQERYQAVG